MKRKKEDRPYFDDNRDYVGELENENEKNSPFNREVIVQEKVVMRTLRKKWLRYRDAEIVYSLENKKILEMADQAMRYRIGEKIPGIDEFVKMPAGAGR